MTKHKGDATVLTLGDKINSRGKRAKKVGFAPDFLLWEGRTVIIIITVLMGNSYKTNLQVHLL